MPGWETSFVAMRVALGASALDASADLTPDGYADASGLLAALEEPSRGSRARALASAVAVIAVEVERAKLS